MCAQVQKDDARIFKALQNNLFFYQILLSSSQAGN